MTILEPIRKQIRVHCSAEHAFRVFALETDSWWPLPSHSLGGDRARSCGFDPHAGGEVFETDADGGRSQWGRVLTWEPPERVVFSWFVGRPETTAQTIEVTFRESDGATTVELVHRGWETFGRDAAQAHAGYESGWDEVFGACFGDACAPAPRQS